MLWVECTFVYFVLAFVINLVVSLNLVLFQPVGLLSFSASPFLAGEGSLGDRATSHLRRLYKREK